MALVPGNKRKHLGQPLKSPGCGASNTLSFGTTLVVTSGKPGGAGRADGASELGTGAGRAAEAVLSPTISAATVGCGLCARLRAGCSLSV